MGALSAEKSPCLIASVGIVLFTVADSLRFSVSQEKKKNALFLIAGPPNVKPKFAFERRRFRGIEKVPGIELLIAEKVIRSAVKQIRSRFHCKVHNSASSSPKLCWIRIRLNFKLLYCIDGG